MYKFIITILLSTAFSIEVCSKDCKEIYVNSSMHFNRVYGCTIDFNYNIPSQDSEENEEEFVPCKIQTINNNGGIFVGGSLKLLETSRMMTKKNPRIPIPLYLLRLIPPINFRIGGLATIQPISYTKQDLDLSKNTSYEYNFYDIYYQIEFELLKNLKLWTKSSTNKPKSIQKNGFYYQSGIGMTYNIFKNYLLGCEVIGLVLSEQKNSIIFDQNTRISISLGYEF